MDSDPINQAECGGGMPLEQALTETFRELRIERDKLVTERDDLLAACEALVTECKRLRERHDEACDYVAEYSIDETVAEKMGKTAIRRAEGGAA